MSDALTVFVPRQIPWMRGREHTCRATDEGNGWYTECEYLTYRDRTHGSKRPVERKLPKCTLFDKWLEQSGVERLKCAECLNACLAALPDKENLK